MSVIYHITSQSPVKLITSEYDYKEKSHRSANFTIIQILTAKILDRSWYRLTPMACPLSIMQVWSIIGGEVTMKRVKLLICAHQKYNYLSPTSKTNESQWKKYVQKTREFPHCSLTGLLNACLSKKKKQENKKTTVSSADYGELWPFWPNWCFPVVTECKHSDLFWVTALVDTAR